MACHASGRAPPSANSAAMNAGSDRVDFYLEAAHRPNTQRSYESALQHFFAGGAATILEIVSMSVSLRIGLHSNGSDVRGYGEFSVEIGCSPFEWTLTYSVERNISGGGGYDRALTPSADGSPTDSTDPHELFTNPANWDQFRTAFAER